MQHISLESFCHSLEKAEPNYQKKKYLLAVSGGADSMVLAFLFLKTGLSFEIAHINYHLRGEDSNLDEKIVGEFCNNNSIPLHSYHVQESDQKPKKGSIQLWARELRYRFFFEIREKRNLNFVVMAHHLNDQLETFLINLSKASGMNGLCGMPSNQNLIQRPMLGFSKKQIYQFAKANNVAYREDISNQKDDYLRNRIRHHIVPELEKTNDNFLANFYQSLQHLENTKELLSQQVEKTLQEITKFHKQNQWEINREKWENLSPQMKQELLFRWGFSKGEQEKINKLTPGNIFYSHEFSLEIRKEVLLKSKIEKQWQDPLDEIQLHLDQVLIEPIENNHILITEKKQEKKEITWILDKEKVSLPLFIRHRKDSDVFYPSKMKGRKLVSKFFKDKKIPILARAKTWILVDSKDNILGIIPYRQDRRFASTDNKNNLYLYL